MLRLDKEMEWEFKSGLMVQSMRVSGRTIKQTEEADWCMLMRMCMRENGRMIRQKVMELIITLMEQYTRESGRMINSMAMGKKHG